MNAEMLECRQVSFKFISSASDNEKARTKAAVMETVRIGWIERSLASRIRRTWDGELEEVS